MRFLTCVSALLSTIIAKCQASKATCRVNPDPHFRTFDNIPYDYHGGCDLVLIKNPTFPGGPLYLHIRTVPFIGWGGITNVALRIGADTLEVNDGNDWYFNGVLNLPLTVMGTAAHAVSYVSTTLNHVWEVALPNMQYIRISNWGLSGGRVSVEVYADETHFTDSVGLCGTWGTPGLIARDGVTDLQPSGVDMGEEWQVDLSLPEPQLFQDPPAGGPCTPNNTTGVGNGGGADRITRDAAEEFCENVEGLKFNNCVFDVLTTQDPKWADAPHYHKYDCKPRSRDCQRKGGECMERSSCNGDTHYCEPKLCAPDTVPHWLFELDMVGSGNGNRLLAKSTMHRHMQDDEVDQPGENISDLRNPCVCAIPRPFNSGQCCKYKAGGIPYMCAGIEALPLSEDIDGRCNAVNQGNSCEWNYNDPDCCEIAMSDGNCELPNDEAVKACKGCA